MHFLYFNTATMKVLFILLFSLFLFSCSQQQSQQLPESEVIAKVGDELITADLLNSYMIVNGIVNADAEMINTSLNNLIEETAMANIAVKKKLPMSKEQLNNFKYLQIRALASNAKSNYLVDHIITEEEIQEEYNKVNEKIQGQQYHVHHLLYTDEIEAISILETLKTAEDFKIKEIEYLLENQNKRNVGDLGWVTLLQLPKSFVDILPNMIENSVFDKVIASQFGAHIVYLEAIRDMPAPAFEDVKTGIENTLKAKKLSKFTQLAKAKAHVKIIN